MALRVRFVLGRNSGGKVVSSEQRSRSFASAIARQVAFQAAENSYRSVKAEIAKSFQNDAKRELNFLMALYRRHIIGADSRRAQPSGMLRYALGNSDTDLGFDDENYLISDMLPGWAPRSPEYLASKRKRGWAQGWFSATGLLKNELTADFLLQAYGPIRVSVIRDVQATENPAPLRGGTTLRTFGPNSAPAASASVGDVRDARIRLQVATVRIFAMEAITPSMLPALASGQVNAMNNDDPQRGRRFLAPIFAANKPLAYRLGQLDYKTHRYRPTLEPFLAWFLTRAIPNALALRLEQRSIGKARRMNIVRR